MVSFSIVVSLLTLNTFAWNVKYKRFPDSYWALWVVKRKGKFKSSGVIFERRGKRRRVRYNLTGQPRLPHLVSSCFNNFFLSQYLLITHTLFDNHKKSLFQNKLYFYTWCGFIDCQLMDHQQLCMLIKIILL